CTRRSPAGPSRSTSARHSRTCRRPPAATSSSSSASWTSRSRSSAPAPSARASSRERDANGPRAADEAERPGPAPDLPVELVAGRRALLVVEGLRPLARRAGAVHDGAPQLLEARIARLGLEQLGLPALADERLELLAAAVPSSLLRRRPVGIEDALRAGDCAQ